MGTPYLGEIRIVGFNFAPRGFALCDGQLLSISQNDALFALLGTTYGGDGQVTFALPDFRGRIPVHVGTGPSGTSYALGQTDGRENVTILASNLPGHTHALIAATPTTPRPAQNVVTPTSAAFMGASAPGFAYGAGTATVPMSGTAVGSAGLGEPVSVIKPVVALNFIICLEGVFPSRN